MDSDNGGKFAMDASSSGPETVERLAESFMERLRRGERPSISDYAARFPDLAHEIREVFPALAAIEEFAPQPLHSARAAYATHLERLGEFRILRQVGRGGMGIVYEAVQESLGRRVALKVLSHHLASDPVCVERFQREARAAARMHHTNLVPVFDVGEHDGTHYYVMQFIQGLSLDKVLRELRRITAVEDAKQAPRAASNGSKPGSSPLSRSVASGLWSGRFATNDDSNSQTDTVDSDINAASRVHLPGQAELSTPAGSRRHYCLSVARVGLQVADGLEYLHTQGLVHRDIKPSNLLLDTRGVVWITDLGLVREQEAEALTRSGDVVGTLQYMPPERLQGEIHPSGDMYGLGLTLYELLTLRPAFDSTDRAELTHKISAVEPTPIRQIAPDVPRDLETIVLKAIDKDPRARYSSAEALGADLRSFLEDRPIRARRAGTLERSWRWCRRNRAVATLLGSVAALLVVIALGSTLAALVFRDQATRLGEQAHLLSGERSKATQRLYEALVSQVEASRRSGRPGQRSDGLVALADAGRLIPQLGLGDNDRLQLRNEAIACLTLVDLTRSDRVHRVPRGTRFLAVDAALERYAVSDGQGKVSIRRIDDDRLCATLPCGSSRIYAGQFSPDGHYLIVKDDHRQPPAAAVWDASRATVVLEFPDAACFDFSRDARWLACAGSDGTIRVVELAAPHQERRFRGVDSPSVVRFDPQGRRIAVGSLSHDEVRILDLDVDCIVGILHPPRAIFDIAWRDQGTLLACGCADYRVHVWNTDTLTEQAVLGGHQAEVTRVVFNPAGNLLVSSSWDGTTRLWNPWSGESWLSVAGEFQRFNLDGQSMMIRAPFDAADAEFATWEISGGMEFRTLHEPPSPDKHPSMVDFSPDGRWLASTGPDGLRIWNRETGEIAAEPFGREDVVARDATALFRRSGDGVLTTCAGGLQLCPWPPSDHLGLAGPTTSLVDHALGRISQDEAGRTLAGVDGARALVVDSTHGFDVRRLGWHVGASRVAISPDGKYIASGTWRGSGVKLWDATSGAEIATLFNDAGSATVFFSPDGKWLMAGANGVYRFWEVGSWKQSHDLAGAFPYHAAFARDGKLLAICRSLHDVKLVDPSSGHELATLSPPSGQPISWLCFSPDGQQLAVACGTHVIQLWDLALIREQLAPIGLDWESSSDPIVAGASRP